MQAPISSLDQALAALVATALTAAFFAAVGYDSDHISDADQVSLSTSPSVPAPAPTAAAAQHAGTAG